MKARRSACDVGRDLATRDGLVQSGERLGTKERRCEELMRFRNLEAHTGQVEGGSGVDNVLGHRVPHIGVWSVTTLMR